MQHEHPEPTPRRPVWMWAGAAAGLGLAVTMFLNNSAPHARPAASRPSTGTFVISGTVVLGDRAFFAEDGHGGCAGTGTRADVVDGAPVHVMTTGGFASGKLTDPQTTDNGACRFSFTIPAVPAGQDAYLVMIADQEPRQFAEQDLTSGLASLRLD